MYADFGTEILCVCLSGGDRQKILIDMLLFGRCEFLFRKVVGKLSVDPVMTQIQKTHRPVKLLKRERHFPEEMGRKLRKKYLSKFKDKELWRNSFS